MFYWIVCLAASFGYFLCLASDELWFAELAIHWRLHMAIVSLVFMLLFLYLGRNVFMIWMLLLTIGFTTPILQVFAPAPAPNGEVETKLKILQFNVLYKNDNFAKSIPWIIKQNADIVVLQEINEARSKELEQLKKHYKWSQVKVNEKRDAFGMAIFSNQPVISFDYIYMNDGWNNYTLTKFMISDIRLNLYELHTPPPIYRSVSNLRNMNLKLIADIMARDKTPHRILIGDLNSTIYSPNFQDIIARAGLHHSQQGYNFDGTWPSWLPYFLRIGIDQMLLSRQIRVENRKVSPYQGSDHLPVITNLTLYEDL